MLESLVDPDLWLDELPATFSTLVVPPLHFETHVDAAAHARKVVGLDALGQRCYVQHTHTRTEDRFDIDEFPLEVAALRERRLAWRLASGRWLRLTERLDRLGSCRPRLQRDGPDLVEAFPSDL